MSKINDENTNQVSFSERLEIAKRDRPFKTRKVNGVKQAYRDARDNFEILDEAFTGQWRDSVRVITMKTTILVIERTKGNETKRMNIKVSELKPNDKVMNTFYIEDSHLITRLEVYNQKLGQWLHFEDVGVESDWSPEKGMISNGIKRVAPHVGVSRDLYTVYHKGADLGKDAEMVVLDEKKKGLLFEEKEYLKSLGAQWKGKSIGWKLPSDMVSEIEKKYKGKIFVKGKSGSNSNKDSGKNIDESKDKPDAVVIKLTETNEDVKELCRSVYKRVKYKELADESVQLGLVSAIFKKAETIERSQFETVKDAIEGDPNPKKSTGIWKTILDYLQYVKSVTDKNEWLQVLIDEIYLLKGLGEDVKNRIREDEGFMEEIFEILFDKDLEKLNVKMIKDKLESIKKDPNNVISDIVSKYNSYMKM